MHSKDGLYHQKKQTFKIFLNYLVTVTSGWDGKEKVELNLCKSEMAFSILGSNI